MGYILDLRKFVGHRPLIQVGAGIIVEDPEGRVLLQLRSDNHCWGYCGGSIELDERVEDAAKRELFEETGLTAEDLSLFGVWSGPELHYVYPNGDEVSNIDIVFLCRKFSGTLKRPLNVCFPTDWVGRGSWGRERKEDLLKSDERRCQMQVAGGRHARCAELLPF